MGDSVLHLFASLILSAHAGIFDLDQILQQRQVAVIGWAQTDANPVPEILAQELPNSVVVLTEDSYGYPFYQPEVFPNIGHFIEVAQKKGLVVDGADHPSVYEFRLSTQSQVDNPELPLLLRLLYGMDTPKVSRAERDKHMTQIIATYAEDGQKVVLLVGNSHIPGITKNLKLNNVSFVARATNLDYDSGDVLLDGKIIGRMRATEQWAKLRSHHHGVTHLDSLSWQPDTSSLGKKILNQCANLLAAAPNPADAIRKFDPAEIKPL